MDPNTSFRLLQDQLIYIYHIYNATAGFASALAEFFKTNTSSKPLRLIDFTHICTDAVNAVTITNVWFQHYRIHTLTLTGTNTSHSTHHCTTTRHICATSTSTTTYAISIRSFRTGRHQRRRGQRRWS